MIGAEPPKLVHIARETGEARLTVHHLSLPREDQFGVDLHGIDLQVRAGEIVGIAGVSGNGQRELLYALSGEDCRSPKGSIRMGEEDVAHIHPGAGANVGFTLFPKNAWGAALFRS